MDAFKKLNFLSERKPCSGFTKLNIGFHAIEYFKIVNSKFGIKKNEDEPPKSLLVELTDRTVFLPNHFLERLTQQDLDEMNKSSSTIYLFFGGKSADT